VFGLLDFRDYREVASEPTVPPTVSKGERRKPRQISETWKELGRIDPICSGQIDGNDIDHK
jgi:hypothetical protein